MCDTCDEHNKTDKEEVCSACSMPKSEGDHTACMKNEGCCGGGSCSNC